MNPSSFLPRVIGLAAFLLLATIPSYAEILPTQGIFKGIYHVNRAGVGRFSFFIVPKRLQDQMAPYKDKYIEVEVIKSNQPINPGDAIIDQIGKVSILDSPPLEIRLKTVSPGASGADTFDVICELVNTGKSDVMIDGNIPQVGISGYAKPLAADEVDSFLGTGYTSRQLSFGGTSSQQYNFLSPMEPGEATHFYTRRMGLKPGESAPFVLHSVKLEPGEYELSATGAYYPNKDDCVPLMVAEPLDVPLRRANASAKPSLRCETEVRADDEWFVIKGRLLPIGNDPAFIFTRPADGNCLLPGLVQLWSASGMVLPATLDWPGPDAPWSRAQVGSSGLPFTFRVRHDDRFSQEPIAKITFWTVTGNGVEKLTLSDSLPDLRRGPLPQWGDVTNGCRLRIDVPKQVFTSDERIRLFFQTESDGTAADVFWMDKNHFASHVLASVDGVPEVIGTTGVSDAIVYKFPFQGEIVLSSFHKVTPGKHVFQLSIEGDPGAYTNLRDEKFRKFNGKLVSNKIPFEFIDQEPHRATR